MTQPQPQRCDHECVCGRYQATAIIYKSPCPAGSDIYESCTHDTRATRTPAAPAERLCDDCNIIELEEKVMHLEQDLKDVHKAERKYVLDGFDW